MEILRIENVTKTYGEKDTAVHALDRVSFSVEEGEFVAVTGPSGSGKSTLLHILGGVDKPDSGTVQVKGTDIFRLNETNQAIFRRRHIGLIYQFYNLIPILTVEENILTSIAPGWEEAQPEEAGADSFDPGAGGSERASAKPALGRPAAESICG